MRTQSGTTGPGRERARGSDRDEAAAPLADELLSEAAKLGSQAARRRFLAGRPELRSEAAVRACDEAVQELAARAPREALHLAELAALIAKSLGEDAQLVASMTRARALFRLARYREADALLLHVATARSARGELGLAGHAHTARLGPLTNLGELDEALSAAAQAARCLRGKASAVARALLEANRGMVLQRLGRPREALGCFVRARPAVAGRGDRRNAAILDLNRAQAHSQLGEPKRAARLFAQARRVFEELGQTVLVASVDYNSACDDFTCGRFDRAWQRLEAARQAFASLGDGDYVARADLDLAEVAWRLGSPQVAREKAALARRGFERLGARLDTARAQCVEALVLARTGAPKAAAAALASAASAFGAEGHALRAALANLDLASLLVHDDPMRAARLARRSGRSLKGTGVPAAEARALLVEGRALASRGSPRARGLLLRAAALARRRNAPDIGWQAESELAALERAAGRSSTARARLVRAVAALDGLRHDLRRLEPARWVLRDGGPVYEQAIAAWLEEPVTRHRSERAFLLAESARTRSLANVLALASGGERAPLLLQRRLDLEPAVESEGLKERDADGWSALTGSRDGRASTSERSAALRGALHRGERLVEFQRLGDSLWAFVLDRDGLASVPLGNCAHDVDELLARLDFQFGKFAHLREHADRFLPTLRRQADGLLDELGRLLLRPLADRLRGGRLIVVPTRELHGAPFGALRLDGHYLIETMTTSVAPSCLVLALLRRRRRRGQGALVVGVGKGSLSHVRKEAREVAALLPDSLLLSGRRADRRRFLEGVRGKAIVHVATHGVFRPERPTLSSLELADGPLTVADVLDLPLRAGLVTLTACDSGRSRIGPGDEFDGLARAFLHAGARSVLVSLWSLDDRQARRVMRAFYRRLGAGGRAPGPAEALRGAVLGQLSAAPHPFFWAPFTLVGAP